jgi:pimeloyl-ACP methyl ester carboxylesterase
LDTLLTPLANFGAEAFVGGLFAPDSPPPGYVEAIKAFTVRPTHFRAHADELKQMAKGLRQQSSDYGEIRVPVTILTGTDDRASPPDAQAYLLHQAIPHAQLLTFSATGHAPHHKYPSTVMDAIRQSR